MMKRWTGRSGTAAATLAVVLWLSAPLWEPRPVAAEPPSTVLPAMVTRETTQRVEKGLRYLERTQRHDGSWLNASGYGSYPMTMTSLAGLALMASGSTPESGPYSRSLSKALNWVLNSVESHIAKDDKKVFISTGGGGESRSMYGHGFGMLFLAQCYGVEGDKSSDRAKRIKHILDGAVALTAAAQSDMGAAQKHAGGWTYSPNARSDEGSVTVTQLQALRACRNAGIKVPQATIDRTVRYLQLMQNEDGGIRYSSRSGGGSQKAISAAAIACFYMAGIYDRVTGGRGKEATMVERLVQYCKNNISVERASGHHYYTHLYYAQAMYQRGGADWKTYYPQMRDWLLARQALDGNWNGDHIGPVYGTAIACIILQLPWGYLPIVQK